MYGRSLLDELWDNAISWITWTIFIMLSGFILLLPWLIQTGFLGFAAVFKGMDTTVESVTDHMEEKEIRRGRNPSRESLTTMAQLKVAAGIVIAAGTVAGFVFMDGVAGLFILGLLFGA